MGRDILNGSNRISIDLRQWSVEWCIGEEHIFVQRNCTFAKSHDLCRNAAFNSMPSMADDNNSDALSHNDEIKWLALHKGSERKKSLQLPS